MHSCGQQVVASGTAYTPPAIPLALTLLVVRILFATRAWMCALLP